MYFTIDHDAYDLPDYAQVMELYDAVYEPDPGSETESRYMHWMQKVW